jgi:hypothetical protein
MAESGAFDLKRGDRIYRAPSAEVLVRWAGERRISSEDGVRKAGTAEWKRASEVADLSALLDPANWWTVKMGESSWIAQDFDTIVRWAREGRLTTDAVIEGPRTPPGGALAQGLPRLAPFLRTPVQSEAGAIPPRLQIDGIEYYPGGVETVRQWILESRIPPESRISLAGGAWERVSECGLFEPEIWPAGSWGEEMPDEEEPSAGEAPPVPSESKPDPSAQRGDSAPFASTSIFAPDNPLPDGHLRIVTLTEDFTVSDPAMLVKLLKSRRIHTFDDVISPILPEGRCSVDRAMEVLRLRKPGRFPWAVVWVFVLLGLGAVFVLVDPLDLNLLK